MKLKNEKPTVFAIYHDLNVFVFVNDDGSVKCYVGLCDRITSYWVFKEDEIPLGQKTKIMSFSSYFEEMKNEANVEYFCYYYEKKYPCCFDAYYSWTKNNLDQYLASKPDMDERYKYIFDNYFNEA